MSKKGKVGIIVSGGPAPGINAVIGASVIEANNRGVEVIGFQDGFVGASTNDRSKALALSISDVSRVYNTGGSILGTSRFNPFSSAQDTENLQSTLKEHNIDKLIIIGGDGSIWLSHKLSKQFPTLRIAHIPKTIDNDIDLPDHQQTFGFETARFYGASIVDTLAVDAKTCKRWYITVTMGRQAGFLALGIVLASGGTLAFIPEEFEGKKHSIAHLAKKITPTIIAREQAGKPYGVIVLAEGLLDCIDPASSDQIKDLPVDELGRITYSELELSDLLIPELEKELDKPSITLKSKNIGYELRCAPPVSFDIEYAKYLGFGAIECLEQRPGAFLITRNHGGILPLPLEQFLDGERVRSRTVDLQSDYFRIAQHFMIKGALADPK